MIEKHWDKILVGFLVLAQTVMIFGLWSKLQATSEQLAKTEHFAAKLAIDRQYFYDKILGKVFTHKAGEGFLTIPDQRSF